jgi:hypothetical protein
MLHAMGVDLAMPCVTSKLGAHTPVFICCALGSVDCLRELHALGVDLDRGCDKFGNKPCKIATMKNQSDSLAALGELGVSLKDYRDKVGPSTAETSLIRSNTAAAALPRACPATPRHITCSV